MKWGEGARLKKRVKTKPHGSRVTSQKAGLAAGFVDAPHSIKNRRAAKNEGVKGKI